MLPGGKEMLQSEPATSTTLGPVPRNGAYYLVLHGGDYSNASFEGEAREAFSVAQVPKKFSGVVFASSCWGALISQTSAHKTPQGSTPLPRTIERSIALSFLRAGAIGYVGCTGAHHSPLKSPFNYYGGPMHRHFWKHVLNGNGPSRALHLAKEDYRNGYPHGRTSLTEKGVEMKTLGQFTCLGLGW